MRTHSSRIATSGLLCAVICGGIPQAAGVFHVGRDQFRRDVNSPTTMDTPSRFNAQRRGVSSASAESRAPVGRVPSVFVKNDGQMDPRVAYYLQGGHESIYFTSQGVTFSLSDRKHRETAGRRSGDGKRWILKLDFVGAAPDVTPTGQRPTPALVSYFKGPKTEWRTGSRTYRALVYSDLWPGIDLSYVIALDHLKYTFVVKPGADPSRIQLAYRGASAVRHNDSGQLEVSTPFGNIRDDRPYVYQDVDGQRVQIGATYSLAADEGGPQTYGFTLGAYDKTKPLVLDPELFIYAGYIGGTARDEGRAIAVDTEGNAYVTGETKSLEASFPVQVGPDLEFNGAGIDTDAFVAKVSADGTELLYAGYIGGNDYDTGRGIAVDVAGNAYVTGWTNSTEDTFPVLIGPDVTYNGGADFFGEGLFTDAFVAKVSADGSRLLYAGYIGGSLNDFANGIVVDALGRAYLVGHTQSPHTKDVFFPIPFPVKVGPDLTFNGLGGDFDAFIARVSSNGAVLDYCGYIGGFSTDHGWGIAVDEGSHAYVAGDTVSTEDTFPDGDPDDNNDFAGVVGPDQTHNGSADAFVAKVSPDGTQLLFAGYIGGQGQDFGGLQAYEGGLGIALDADRNAYIAGQTTSSEDTFPIQAGPGPRYNGGGDAFVAKVSADGTHLWYAGYLGGREFDGARAIAVDAAGHAYVTGFTRSTDFPVKDGPQRTHNGGEDAFVTALNPDGRSLIFSSYVGGVADESGRGIAVDHEHGVYITGITDSDENSFPVNVGPDLEKDFDKDAFVAKIAFVSPVPTDIDIRPNTFPNPVNPLGPGFVPVAVLTTETMSAASIDPASVRFGGTGIEAAPVKVSLVDVDADFDVDLLIQFRVQDTGIRCGQATASLTGMTFDKRPIRGSDSIKTVPCK